jgi:hypothetical protein
MHYRWYSTEPQSASCDTIDNISRVKSNVVVILLTSDLTDNFQYQTDTDCIPLTDQWTHI